PPAAGITPSRKPPDLAIRVPRNLKALAAFDVGIDRHHRAPSTGGLRRVPRAARGRLDGAADAALSESAARPHRGADLWPRMAARLRQIAAVAVVAGRAGLPDDWGRRRLLRAGADRGGGGVCGGLADRSPAGRRRRRARGRPLSRRP